MKIRFKYTKEGSLRWLSHLEVARLLRRAIRRAGIQVGFSEGFNPHERMSFGPPTSVGMASVAEYCDVVLADGEDIETFTDRLSRSLPPDTRVLGAAPVQPGQPSLGKTIKRCVYGLDCSRWRVEPRQLQGALEQLLQLTMLEASSKSGPRQIRIAGDVAASLVPGSGSMVVDCKMRHDVKPALIVDWLADKLGCDSQDVIVTRLEQATEDGVPLGITI